MTAATPPSQARSRAILLLIAAIFLAPLATALYLFYTDWHPAHTRNYGDLLDPVRDLRVVHFTRADGSRFAWNHEDKTWRVLVAAPADCGAACDRLADTLRRVWVGLGNNADHVQVLWVGPAPKAGFRALVPVTADASLARALPDVARPDAIPVYVVDPSGFLFLRHPPGFDPGHLRKDLQRMFQQNM